MIPEIAALAPEDIRELSRFLIDGFHAPADAEFAAPDILEWKYFDPRGADDLPRSFVARAGGRIVGHVGMCPTSFCIHDERARNVSTLQMVDWLGSREHPGVGSMLMRRVHQSGETQYGLGATEAALRVARGVGYEARGAVPVYQCILRPSYRLRIGEGSAVRNAFSAARDFARVVSRRDRASAVELELRHAATFGPEVEPIIDRIERPVIFTSRTTTLLNHYLRHPRGRMSGHLITMNRDLVGFAIVGLVTRGKATIGKIGDCFLATRDPATWHAAIAILVRNLRTENADVVQAIGTTPWVARALEENGFSTLHQMDFMVRDRKNLIPRDIPVHLSFLEADYAYT
jgi:hypothetical protein